MIVTRCPLRIGLAGGSSDLDKYMIHHGRGAVVSFPIDVYTYTTLHSDSIGHNTCLNKYLINYSEQESPNSVENIKNDIVREVFEYFDIPPCSVSMAADVFSSGSGLASSSSFMISMIKSAIVHKSIKMSNFEISKLAMELERKFNPLLGYQDTYGCGVGSLKRMDFKINEFPKITYLPVGLLESMDMYAVFTGVTRSSTEVLKSVGVSDDKSLLHLVDDMESCLKDGDRERFIRVIKEGWKVKKSTSESIASNEIIKEMDKLYEEDKRVLCHRLCGAGNGGFFLIFCEKGAIIDFGKKTFYKKINIDYKGVSVIYGDSR